MVSRWRLWKIGLFVGSGLMYYLAQWSNMMVSETVQQNGIHAIVYPYSDLAYYSSSIASWLLIFGIFLLPIRIRQGEKPQRLLMGCALLSCGIVAAGYGVFLQGGFHNDSHNFSDRDHCRGFRSVVARQYESSEKQLLN